MAPIDKTFLLIFNDYATTNIVLFTTASSSCHPLSHSSIDNKKASAHLLSAIDALLKARELSLSDMLFIAAHRGPCPFTTLRTVLATVNGLAHATGITLIGVDGLDAFFEELRQAEPLHSGFYGILHNAFCDDLYYAFYNTQTGVSTRGSAPKKQVLEHIGRFETERLVLVGNAVRENESALCALGRPEIQFSVKCQEFPSSQALGSHAWKRWLAGNQESTLSPLYLKEPVIYTNV